MAKMFPPDEAPAGLLRPEPPPWLMASTRSTPSWQQPPEVAPARTYLAGAAMNIYYVAAIWLGMALLASVVSIRIAVPAAPRLES
jgi:hypothetical protein